MSSQQSENSISKDASHGLPAISIVDLPERIERLAIFHLNGVGDMVFSLPALESIRARFPDAHITSIIRPHLQEMLEPSGLADEILCRPEKRGLAGKLTFLRKLRRGQFDVSLLFSQSASANIYARLSGAPVRIGFVDTIFPRLLSHPINLRGISSTDKLLYLAQCVGAEPKTDNYIGALKIGQEQHRRADSLLQATGLAKKGFAILSFGQGPGPIADYKTWPQDNFACLGQELQNRGITPLIVGGKAEAAKARQLAAEIGENAVSIAGETSLGQLAAIIGKARLLIGIDSGPLHIAASLGIPTVGIYGPTDPKVTGPQGEHCVVLRKEMPCAPCRVPTCDGRPCITGIAPEEVLMAAEKLLLREASKHELRDIS